MDVSLAKLLLETRGKEILSKVKLVNMFTQDGKAELPVKVQTEKFIKQEAAAAKAAKAEEARRQAEAAKQEAAKAKAEEEAAKAEEEAAKAKREAADMVGESEEMDMTLKGTETLTTVTSNIVYEFMSRGLMGWDAAEIISTPPQSQLLSGSGVTGENVPIKSTGMLQLLVETTLAREEVRRLDVLEASLESVRSMLLCQRAELHLRGARIKQRENIGPHTQTHTQAPLVPHTLLSLSLSSRLHRTLADRRQEGAALLLRHVRLRLARQGAPLGRPSRRVHRGGGGVDAGARGEHIKAAPGWQACHRVAPYVSDCGACGRPRGGC